MDVIQLLHELCVYTCVPTVNRQDSIDTWAVCVYVHLSVHDTSPDAACGCRGLPPFVGESPQILPLQGIYTPPPLV